MVLGQDTTNNPLKTGPLHGELKGQKYAGAGKTIATREGSFTEVPPSRVLKDRFEE